MHQPMSPPPAPPRRASSLEPVKVEQTMRKVSTPNAKRHDLSKLPADWRAKVFAATERRRVTKQPPSKLRFATAVLWSTGCRPAEIEKGVEVELVEHGRILAITITGAKVGELPKPGGGTAQRGIQTRRLFILADLHEGSRFLAERATAGPIIVQADKDGLRTNLHKAGAKALVRSSVGVSPYLFRHAMGSDLKSCDDPALSDVTRSSIMGHLSTASLSKYGRRRRGGTAGPSPVLAVQASAKPHGGDRSRWVDGEAAPIMPAVSKPKPRG